MRSITIKALSQDAINSQLSQQLSCSQPRSMVNVNYHGQYIFGWKIQAKGGDKPPLVKVNGTAEHVFQTRYDKDSGIASYFTTPYPHAIKLKPNRNTVIEIEAEKNQQLLHAEAVDRVPTSYLLALTRGDIINAAKEEVETWITIHGINEMNLLRQDISIISTLNQKMLGSGRCIFHGLIWDNRPDLLKEFGSIESQNFLDWLLKHGRAEYNLPQLTNLGHLKVIFPLEVKREKRPFGVNLIGYESSILGIGEDLRTCKDALEANSIPTKIIDIPTKSIDSKLRLRARTEFEEMAPYAINLICTTAEEHARIFLELGYQIFNERYNIGYWPWELSKWPLAWKPLFGLVDEVWSSSEHTYNAISRELLDLKTTKLSYQPLGISYIKPLSEDEKKETRKSYSLEEEAMLCICSFDGRSSFHRKNPWGAIKAFRLAFPEKSDAKVGLIIKTMNAAVDPQEWNKLSSLVADDSRIRLIDESLDKKSLMKLYGCCDVLISLHRAEGFGRILGECLLLGLEVVATNYSGNIDFCKGSHANKVNFDLTDVLENQYPHWQNQLWAEPNIDHASKLLKDIYSRHSSQGIKRDIKWAATIRSYQKRMLTQSIANNYSNRLADIWKSLQGLGEEPIDLKWNRNKSLYSTQPTNS